MAYREVVESAAPLPIMQVHGDHVELVCTFVTGGTAVSVSSPTLILTAGGGSGSTVPIPSGNLLVPFSKYGTGDGTYHVTFLAGGWLDDGDYEIKLEGIYCGSTLQQLGTFSAHAANGVQGYIERLRAALHDYDGSLYLIEDPTRGMFSDGDLYSALNRALDKINYTKPNRYTWNLTGCPWPGLLIDGGVIYALHSRGVLEIANTIQYSDEITFTIDRSQKYITALGSFANTWEINLQRVKMDYAFTKAFPIGMGQVRIPYAQTRIFSFIPQLALYLNYGV